MKISASNLQAPLGITVGDMAGVGPELILRNWEKIASIRPAVVYADLPWLRAAAISLAEVDLIDASMVGKIWGVEPEDAVTAVKEGAIPVVNCAGETTPTSSSYPWGMAFPDFGLVQYRAFRRAIEDALNDRIAGIVTCPWHKARLMSVGLPATGHTEVLARECEVDNVVMMLAGEVFRVALATVHIPLSKVATKLSKELIVSKGLVIAKGLRDLYGIGDPVIALCGLNPHAGEDGIIGIEEEDIIKPAIKELQGYGVRAIGPYPADTLFPMVVRDRIKADAIFAMYHDQGLAPLKTFHLGESTNISLGLPIIRTSVDHGTAYDIAGTGVAESGSLVYAFSMASKFAHQRRAHRSLMSTSEYETP